MLVFRELSSSVEQGWVGGGIGWLVLTNYCMCTNKLSSLYTRSCLAPHAHGTGIGAPIMRNTTRTLHIEVAILKNGKLKVAFKFLRWAFINPPSYIHRTKLISFTFDVSSISHNGGVLLEFFKGTGHCSGICTVHTDILNRVHIYTKLTYTSNMQEDTTYSI